MQDGFDIQDVFLSSLGESVVRGISVIATLWGSSLIGSCAVLTVDLALAVFHLNLELVFALLKDVPSMVVTAPIRPAMSLYGIFFYPFIFIALVIIFVRCEDHLLIGASLCGTVISFLSMIAGQDGASVARISANCVVCVLYLITAGLLFRSVQHLLWVRSQRHLEEIRQANRRQRKENNERFGTVTRPIFDETD